MRPIINLFMAGGRFRGTAERLYLQGFYCIAAWRSSYYKGFFYINHYI